MRRRVMVMAQHQLMREALVALLHGRDSNETIADAGDGRLGAQQAIDLRPDVVVMDLQLAGLNSIDVIQRITVGSPGSRVLCLAADDTHWMMRSALDAGARGILAKDATTEELIRAIAAVSARQLYLSPSLTEAAMNACLQPTGRAGAFFRLTAKEREVVQLLAEGLTTKEAAAKLQVSVKTVASHREHATSKLGIRGVAGLTRYAIREGLTVP